MRNYVGTKIIKAEPTLLGKFSMEQGKELDPRQTPGEEGYKVIYPDDYVSWSPKEVFEEAYREISAAEIALIG